MPRIRTRPQTRDDPSAPEANREALEDVIALRRPRGRDQSKAARHRRELHRRNGRSEMIAVKKRFRKEDGTIAYHGYQSFREGEVTPEQAHRIGIRLAEELWGERYQVLVATHVDKESHPLALCHQYSLLCGRPEILPLNKDYTRMREVSDRLCREYGLSVVRRPEGRREKLQRMVCRENGKPTNRSLIRTDIDRAIAASLTEAEFFQTLANMGYELKLTTESGKALQRPSLRPQGSARFYRFDRLGAEYTLDTIEPHFRAHPSSGAFSGG